MHATVEEYLDRAAHAEHRVRVAAERAHGARDRAERAGKLARSAEAAAAECTGAVRQSRLRLARLHRQAWRCHEEAAAFYVASQQFWYRVAARYRAMAEDAALIKR